MTESPKIPETSQQLKSSKPVSKEMNLVNHLEELRKRLGLSLLTLIVTVGLSTTQVDRIIVWLQRPIESKIYRFAFFTPTEPLVAYLKVSILAGIVLAMPVILWQVWSFIRPGLLSKERMYGLVFVWWGSALFCAGVAFAYYVLLPISLSFLMGIGSQYLEPVISIDRYLSYVTSLSLSCGLIFELPAVLFLLAKIGIVTPAYLRQIRPYAILVMVIVAAIVTPTTDVVSLLLMTCPMLILYEFSIVMTQIAMRNRD